MAEIEYFYSAHSGYAYIGSAKFMEIARTGGHSIVHRPMDLRAVVAVTGPGPTNGLTPQRRLYFSGREIVRWAEARGIGILPRHPTHHDNGIALSNGMLIAGLEQGLDIGPLAHRMLEAHWRDDADLDNRNTLSAISSEVGLDPKPLLDAALTSNQYEGGYRTIHLRFTDLFRRWRHVLRTRSPGTGPKGTDQTLLRNLASQLN